MADLKEKLTEYVQEAHAMEANILQMLDSMIRTTEDPEVRSELEQHKAETEAHETRLEECLESLGSKPATGLKLTGMLGTLGKGAVDQVRSDKPFRNARDGFATEHAEIAVYEVLERLAQQAGEQRVADVARRNRADEERMASTIASNWDKFVKLTLQEEGIA